MINLVVVNECKKYASFLHIINILVLDLSI